MNTQFVVRSLLSCSYQCWPFCAFLQTGHRLGINGLSVAIVNNVDGLGLILIVMSFFWVYLRIKKWTWIKLCVLHDINCELFHCSVILLTFSFIVLFPVLFGMFAPCVLSYYCLCIQLCVLLYFFASASRYSLLDWGFIVCTFLDLVAFLDWFLVLTSACLDISPEFIKHHHTLPALSAHVCILGPTFF